jgi:hypothetical protein
MGSGGRRRTEVVVLLIGLVVCLVAYRDAGKGRRGSSQVGPLGRSVRYLR